jgi:hypothetical protein
MTETLDVVGTEEASEILGVEPGRISRWLKSGKLPPPYSKPSMSPVWFRVDIEKFRDNGLSTEGVTFTTPPRQMPLLGTLDFAALVGVDKSQIGRWRRSPTQRGPRVPEPATHIKAGPLYDRQAVLAFARARRRLARKPAAVAA